MTGGEPSPDKQVLPVHTDGAIFRTADGQPWRWAFCTAFQAAQRWSRGDDLSALADWIHSVGGNGIRVFGQWFNDGGDPIRPTDLSPAQWRVFAQHVTEDLRLYLEITVLTDCQYFNQSHADQCARVQAVANAVAGLPGVFIEICNEPFDNGADVDQIAKDLGYTDPTRRPVLMATGEYQMWIAPHLVLDYLTYHSERGPDWPDDVEKGGHNFRDVYGVHTPVVDDEPIGADEVANGSSRDNVPNNFEDGGAGSSMGDSGATFHASDLCAALVPRPIQQQCAQAFFRGLQYFPADTFAQGRYVHDGNTDFPLVAGGGTLFSEAAGRVIGNSAAIVVAQPIAGWTPQPQGGWSVARKVNPRGNVLWMQKS